MLPYAPVHYLLFAEGLPPLVMTSGNPAEEPLVCENDEALERLHGLADAFLLHDRDIRRRVDDSVVIAAGRHVVPLRRARGYAPSAVLLDRDAPLPILALGGELKTTLCLYRGREAVLSEHIGDLKSPATFRHFLAIIDELAELLHVEPACIAHDLHPGYLSTQYAMRQSKPRESIQHHHAHVAACIAENGVDGPVVGVSCDGTGYGTDGTIWGCEILIADRAAFRRVGHLRCFALPGGDAAARQTFRPAVSVTHQAAEGSKTPTLPDLRHRVRDADAAIVREMISKGVNCPATSSLGRLFDAVAFLVGICEENAHEAQAAMALEDAAREWRECACDGDSTASIARRYPFAIEREAGIILDWRPTIRSILADVAAHRPTGEIAWCFHETVAEMLSQGAKLAADEAGLTAVALTGGSFANQILLARMEEILTASGLSVLTHRRVPPGDGGLALGQAVVAAARRETKS